MTVYTVQENNVIDLFSHIQHCVHFNKLHSFLTHNVCVLIRHLLSCRFQSASHSGSGSGPGAVDVWQLFVGWSLVEAKVPYLNTVELFKMHLFSKYTH